MHCNTDEFRCQGVLARLQSHGTEHVQSICMAGLQGQHALISDLGLFEFALLVVGQALLKQGSQCVVALHSLLKGVQALAANGLGVAWRSWSNFIGPPFIAYPSLGNGSKTRSPLR